MLCGRAYCPLLVRRRALRVATAAGDELYGSSPPSVFVGRSGYPRVRVAALAPPVTGDTSMYDYPEAWAGLPVEDVLSMRLSLIRGYRLADVRRPRERWLEELRLVALSERPVELEARLRGRPRGLLFDEHVPPLGPGAPMEEFRVAGEPRLGRALERAYGDVDMGAGEAIVYLYERGVPVSRIARALSVGALGAGRRRRLVPTRWSITAVDDVVSRSLLGRVRGMPELGEILVYVHRAVRNVFAAILFPGPWGYEWIEAWYPHTAWNPTGRLEVEGDWEGYRGRSSYASLGGCYYAARLAAAEHLARLGRQARVLVVREIYEGFYTPIGVWFVREHVRRLFREAPYRASDAWDAVRFLSLHTRLGPRDWVRHSRLLREELGQRRITEWVTPGGQVR